MQSLVPTAFVGPDLETAWNAFAKPGIYYINHTLAIGGFLEAFGTFGALLVVADDKVPAIQVLACEHGGVRVIELDEFLLDRTLLDQSVGRRFFFCGVLQKDKDLSPRYFGYRSFASARRWQRAPAEGEQANNHENHQ